jgi:flagellar basal body-associated protein FliL
MQQGCKMSNSKNSAAYIKIICSCISIFLFWGSYGCSKDVPVAADERFIGSWRMKKGRGHKDLTFLADGTWLLQIRKQGKLGKVNPEDEEISGTWTVADVSLNMTATKAKEGGSWNINETISYKIIEISEWNMQIKKSNGPVENWARVMNQKTEGKERSAQILSIKPFIVNLSKEKPESRDQYLCIELKFVLRPSKEKPSEEKSSEEKVTVALPKIHPKVREALIFHLGSLTYSEINTMDKLGAVKNNLLQLINPYAKNQIEDISIQNITVTSQWKSVEAFLSQYEEPPAEAKEEHAKTEAGEDHGKKEAEEEHGKKTEEGGH